MKDISYSESVEIESQLFESRFGKRKPDFAMWLISLIVTCAIVGMIGAFMLLVGMSVR